MSKSDQEGVEYMRIYRVYRRESTSKHWIAHSQPFMHMDSAIKCKERCESQKLRDSKGKLIKYTVLTEVQ